MRTSLIYTVLMLAGSLYFSGCGKKPLPEPIKNSSYKSNVPLYMEYSANRDSFTLATSNDPFKYSMRLNNYAPVGFDLKERESVGGWKVYAKPNSTRFRVIECESKIGSTIALNILTLGTGLLIGGCPQHEIFDFKKFDKEAKAWIKTKNIKRKELIDAYEDVQNSFPAYNYKLQTFQTEVQSKYGIIYRKYKEQYKINPIQKIIVKYNDKSGYYKGEKFSVLEKIKVEKNNLPQEITPSVSLTKLNRIVCQANEGCFRKFSHKKQSIIQEYTRKKQQLQDKLDNLQNYETKLQKLIQFYNVSYPTSLQSFQISSNKPKLNPYKTYNYLIKAPHTVNTNDKVIKAPIIIQSVTFKNVFPKYSHQDKNLRVSFDPKRYILRFENLSDKFIEIKTVTYSYNGSVYSPRLLAENKANNFSFELAPKSYQTISPFLYENAISEEFMTIPEATYANMTKKKAKSRNIKFGFAIKYSIGDSTKQKTLYKVKAYNLDTILQNL